MSDWSWASTAGLFGEEDEEDAVDPDQKVSKHAVINIESIYFRNLSMHAWGYLEGMPRKRRRGKTRGSGHFYASSSDVARFVLIINYVSIRQRFACIENGL